MMRTDAVSGDHGLSVTEYAPYGVIGAITPTTNPTSTIICNTIAMLSAGNSIVFNVHPNARECSMANVRLLHRAIVRGGGPPNLVTTVAEPTIESAQALMKHEGVRLLAVTDNLQQASLSPIEEGREYRSLQEKYGWSDWWAKARKDKGLD